MRLPGTEPDCGPLLELGQIQRQLRLGPAHFEGVDAIVVAQIIGTMSRARDFDGCFRPTHAALRKRIDDIIDADPPTLDEPIDVVRVDRAYFVSDGHKRVAIARREGREFIDARISHMPSPYALTPEVEEEAIERTAREGEFRRHSGLAAGIPDARFALTDVTGYGELLMAVQSYSYDRVTALNGALAPADAARLWYEDKYVPAVATGREAVAGLLESITDADIFLALHRQERAAWGGECGEPECVADMLLAEQRRMAASARSPLDRVLNRDPEPKGSTALLLPLAADSHGSDDGGAALPTDENRAVARSLVHPEPGPKE
jgi:hypothetical protein